ncbi:MAG: protease modulator HflC [Deltaproteobacteria bacterium]|nr:MAG: protease modulator HflC [Deltaproteobacteria bacterium]
MARLVIGAIVVALLVLSQTVFVVGEWQQALITQFGKPVRTIREPGLYVKLPVVQTLSRFERRILATDVQAAEYLTLDKKRLAVDHVSRWRISDPLEFYRTVRDTRGAMARLDDIIFARLRQEIAKHNFADFIREKREGIMQVVTAGTREMAASFGIEVVDVRIKRADLPTEVQASVYARMRAERERIAKRYRAEGEERARKIRASADKEREILVAKAYEESQRMIGEGDAQAIATYARAFGQDPEFYGFLRRLESYEKIFAGGTTVVLSPDSDLLRYLQGPGPR